MEIKRCLIDPQCPVLSIRQQCELVGLNRSSFYYTPAEIDAYSLLLMREVDKEYTRHPFYGSRRMAAYLRSLGYEANRKRVQLLYRCMGLEAVYPKPNLSQGNKQHCVFPYLLRGLTVDRINQVWSTDITYIRLSSGFVYLMAVIDWYSRYVLDWSISTTLASDFCIDTVGGLLLNNHCEIFNTDQGAQFTTHKFTDPLLSKGIQVSMDGKGRALDNIFVERLWRSLKYECVYPMNFTTVKEARQHIGEYFTFYNRQRPHQSLRYRTPAEVYVKGAGLPPLVAPKNGATIHPGFIFDSAVKC